jgi:hypothetical protein
MSEHEIEREPALPEMAVDLEEPEADVIEQHLPVAPDPDPYVGPDSEPPPLEADPADVQEQRSSLDADDDYPPTA